jgi:uroporphyrin-III C-methyltransferase
MNRPPAPRLLCSLVGAGPGDPELLTIKALKAIRAATVLLADDLVSDAIIELADPTTRIVHVGKRGHCKSTPQAFIEKLMIAEVHNGERVVRLKGGDPFIFGRGGEEVEALRARGIEVEVINGITSGLAAATSLGVPLTHRRHAHGVLFITGHARRDGAPLHWPTIAATAAEGVTLVIYMGVAEVAHLQAGLLQGLPGSTPVAVVQDASLASQRSLVTRLATLADEIAAQRIGSPAIIVVGNVLLGLQHAHPAGAKHAELHAA